ncbi:Uncharacterized membrane protein YgaE, UPF0421/DUF939 family [Saccharopolyspora kobensis]|uniref:Uncharacterized membrane protein YgaE, UPF0421/DUF939 family n=1 Tax=Saccharopolyspora kobensis TaxID=146035 RepID=A0A1H5VE51_9PSEU|nr:FUSC family protein [Saccharopolyspora kobensis]SEF85108.1 Uncharacterized membrane protein YgaE, UPF0421/DUF939 family [Saccharopolyspora kobensis]SFC62311.1 Uncharacterized membrane protein YgaE, UPF0421/DUF939 family [Saccharopolyspora kobensis]
MSEFTGRAGQTFGKAWRRVAADFWPLLQTTLAVVVSWVLAGQLHNSPFFAPVAAVVALNADRGERGINAVRLMLGVIVGIVVADIALLGHTSRTVVLAGATFVAMLISFALGGSRLVIAQAAAGAILTVTIGDPAAGTGRLLDALIGAGVALVISQVLFPAEPLKLLRRAEMAALDEVATALSLTCKALRTHDNTFAAQAIDTLRNAEDPLSALSGIRKRIRDVARRAPYWWRGVAAIRREAEHSGELDLLDSSCVTLVRTVKATEENRVLLAPAIEQLTCAARTLQHSLNDGAARQRAADRALTAARAVAAIDPGSDQQLSAACGAVRMVATDLVVFAGVEVGEAKAAVRGEIERPAVIPPVAPRRIPFAHRFRLRGAAHPR